MKVFLADGRALRYWSSATPGPVVLFFHGCPDTRRMAMTGDQAAHDVGVRLVAFSRPGYGSSTATESTHRSVAGDAAELLDVWGIERVAVLGMSAGGPYAAAFAATYPERTTALGLVGSPAMTVTESAGTVEDAMERLRPEFMAWRARIDPDDEDDAALAARFLAELPEADAALLRPFGDEFVGNLAWDALVDPTGYLRDAALLFRDLGLRPGGGALPRDGLVRRARREGGRRVDVVGRAAPRGRRRGAARPDPPRVAAHPVAGDPATPRNNDGLIIDGGLRT